MRAAPTRTADKHCHASRIFRLVHAERVGAESVIQSEAGMEGRKEQERVGGKEGGKGGGRE